MNNVYLGSEAGYENISGSNNVFIGYQSGYSETGSNKLYIENSNSSAPLIYGEFDDDQVAINGGATELSDGLTLDVTGRVGATEYCDENGDDCHTIAALAAGASGTAEWNRAGNTIEPNSASSTDVSIDDDAFYHDASTGVTTIDNLQIGRMQFEEDAGAVSWVDLPVTSASADGTKQSYSAQLDGNPLLTIYGASDGSGGIKNMGVSIGSSNVLLSDNIPDNSLIIGDGILCVDNGSDDCDNNPRTAGSIYANSTVVTGVDLAENYPTKDKTLTAGEIVAVDMINPVYVKKYDGATEPSTPLGIVSTAPGLLLGGFDDAEFGDEHRVPVALIGRVPLKITNEGGAIVPGDKIIPSKTKPGFGMKMNNSESMVVATALESFAGDKDSAGEIMVFALLQRNTFQNQ